MKVTIDTARLPPDQVMKIARAVAADAVATVGDLLNDVASATGEAPLPMGIFAQALIEANGGCGPLEVDGAADIKKGIQSLRIMAKEFA